MEFLIMIDIYLNISRTGNLLSKQSAQTKSTN